MPQVAFARTGMLQFQPPGQLSGSIGIGFGPVHARWLSAQALTFRAVDSSTYR